MSSLIIMFLSFLVGFYVGIRGLVEALKKKGIDCSEIFEDKNKGDRN